MAGWWQDLRGVGSRAMIADRPTVQLGSTWQRNMVGAKQAAECCYRLKTDGETAHTDHQKNSPCFGQDLRDVS